MKRSKDQAVGGPVTLWTVVSCLLLGGASHGQTYVDDDNCPGPGSGTLGDPYCSIQDAIDAAADFDEIIVMPGTYFETIDLLGKAINLHSADGPDVTIIDAGGAGTVVTCQNGEGPGTILDGFTVTGGDAPFGGGMHTVGGSPTVTDCVFLGNTAAFEGGGMYNVVSSPTVTDCVFLGNTAGMGGGMYNFNSSSPAVTNCLFSGNSAALEGGGMLNFPSSSPAVTNCTFNGNTAGTDGGGIANYNASNSTVTNCIVWGNTPEQIFDDASSPVVTYSDVQGGYAGTGNVDADPVFIDADGPDDVAGTADDDLRLGSFSPAADAGDNTAPELGGITADLDGNPRFDDDAGRADTGNGAAPIVDMGAYERQDNSSLLIIVPDDFATIQAAITVAVDGTQIEVAPGTYTEMIDFLGKAINLYSAGGPEVTILDALGAGSVVTCAGSESPDTVLDGFTITGGVGVNVGGGMYINSSSPTVINCVFRGNTALSYGGGMYILLSSATVTNCVFSGNTASFAGAGLSNTSSSPTLTNCTFNGNSSGLPGGAIENFQSNPTVTNCILWGNTPDEIFDDAPSTPVVTYSDVQGGYPGAGNVDVDPRFIDADGPDDVAGTADDDLHLDRFSAAADSGDNTAPPLSEIIADLDDNPRFVDDAGVTDTGNGTPPLVDMGAYERQEESSHTFFVFAGESIQDAIDALDDLLAGDEIVVGPGTYNETIDLLGKAITLRSADGPEVTILDGLGAGTVVTCASGEGPDTVLDGFTITGGNATEGGGMHSAGSSPTVTDCIFSGNTATDDGGGMYNTAGSPTVSNCTFSGNTANNGGGMFNLTSSPTVTNCTFSGNTVTAAGGGMFNLTSSPTVTNCTFSGNTAGSIGGAVLNAQSSSPIFVNCILWGNTPDQIFDSQSSPGVTYSDVQGGYPGAGNVDADPLFVDADGADDVAGTIDDDLRLDRHSAAVDAGDNTAPGLNGISTDLDGSPRFVDDADVADTGNGTAPIVDMGAYERQEDSGPAPILVFAGESIQDAIDLAVDEGEIIVGPGTYNETIDFGGKAITLRSADGPAATIIDALGAGTVVSCTSGEGPDTVLEGFTITGGVDSIGGGMHNNGTNPTVIGCVFIGNTVTGAGTGGGMYNQSASPIVINCVFSGNTAPNGGGMANFAFANPTVTNCTFSGNTAGNLGGGMLNAVSSSPTVTNCIVWDNTPNQIFDDASSPVVTYSDVQGGYAGTGNVDAEPRFIDADGADDVPGTLDDDLRLDRFSPATDAGDNAAPPPSGITTDLDGSPRFVDDAGVTDTGNGTAPLVDIGAYERQDESVFVTILVSAGESIQDAIDAFDASGEVLDGDGIEVGPGTYTETINFAGKPMTLRSADGPAVTIIDAAGAGSVVTCENGEGPDTVLEGFTITGGNGPVGGGMRNGGTSPTVTNCIFDGNNATTNGGGMYNSNSSPTVTNCVFRGNSADAGGGMLNRVGSNPTLIACVFSGNSASSNGGGVHNSQSSPTATNCTFNGNSASSAGGGMYSVLQSSPTLTNCILWDNTPDQIFDNNVSSVVTYSDVQGGHAGTGNVDADPQFIDADGPDDVAGTDDDDLRLDRFSAAADAGDNTAPGLTGITTDLDGNPRFADDAGVADSGNGAAPIVDMGAYERQEDSDSITVQVLAGESIQNAINLAFDGDEIVVGPGTYNETIDFGGRAITLRSSDGPAVTILDGLGAGSVVTCSSGEGPDTVLEGFSITGGNAASGGGMRNVNSSSPTVVNCAFIGNTALGGNGGGMFNNSSSSPAVLNCIFIGNAASAGGGMMNFTGSNSTVTNCVFSGNTANFGGGIYNSTCSPAVTNCTFSGNTAPDGGGMANYFGSHPTVTNCVLWDNTPDQIRNQGTSTATVTYSDVQGGYAGTGNVDADPLFVDADGPDDVPGTIDDDLRLDRFTPIADAGDNTAPGLAGIITDLDGSPRLADDAGVADTGNGTAPIVDMGAYERQEDTGPITIQVSAGESIQDAIDAFDDPLAGDEIVVGPGIYNEAINFAGKPITLRSSDGPAVTILDSLGFGTVVTCASGEGPDTVLDGFTITGGALGGMHNSSSSPTVSNCVFIGNTAEIGFGGGMFNDNASPTVIDCVFLGNSTPGGSGAGGGMANLFSSNPTVTNCIFSGNSSNVGGGGMVNLFSSNATVTNCTFSGNVAGGGGAMLNQDSSPTITNCILWGNAPDQIFDDTSSPVVTYSDVQGGYAGAGNVDVDPEFIDADGPDNVAGTLDDDLRLDQSSPAADAGDNTAPDVAGITTDLDGNPRFVDDAGVADSGNGAAPLVDMGAYERQEDSPLLIQVPDDLSTIQAALTVAVDDTEIVVGPGTYTETIDLLGKPVTLRSSDGPEVTIIDALGAGSVISCTNGEGPATVLDGFTLTGGTGTLVGPSLLGGGMYNQGSSPTVTNCIFSGNSVTSDGGGMHNDNASPSVTYCLFTGNTAGSLGGGMSNANASNPAVNHCLFTGNSAAVFGGAMHNFNASDPTMTNCTFADNTAGSDGGGICNVLSNPTLTNAVVWGNTPDQILDVSSAPTVTYSDVQGGYPGVGNIDADPIFQASAAYRLNRFSPCVDAGDNTAPGLSGITVDLDGNARFIDDAGVADSGNGTAPIVDMGAYEQQEESTHTLFVLAGGSIQAEITDAFATGDEIIVGPGTYTETIDFLGKAITLRSADGPAVTIIDGQGAGSVVSCISGEGPDTVLDGFTITGGSTFAGGGMHAVGSSPTVTDCIFSGNSATYGAGMCNESGSSPTVTGCLFSANTATSGGGGMYNFISSSPTVTDCTFTGNTANNFAGGMANESLANATVTGCAFTGNSAGTRGGGLWSRNASPTVTNCTFSGNTAGTEGGGLYGDNSSSLTVTNCTFSGNTAADGGGMANQFSATLTVINCIVWDNTPDQIFTNDAPLPAVTFSDVQGGFTGTGNIDADPLLADADGADDVAGTDDDDLRLLLGSPCVESGDDGAVPGGVTTDIAGLPRFLDGNLDTIATVDMGAHEFDVFADLPVLNVTAQTPYATIEEGVDQALAGDVVAAIASQFGLEPDVGFQGKAITLQSVGQLGQPAGGTYTLADGARLETLGGDDMILDGQLSVPAGDAADVAAGQLNVGGSGALVAQTGASLFVEAAGGAVLSGQTLLFAQSTMSFSDDLTTTGPSTLLSGANLVAGAAFTNAGDLTASSASFVADSMTTDVGGSFIGYGEIFTGVFNDGAMTYIGDTVVTGDYTNNDTTIVQIGTLTIVGSLTNNGTIIGDVAGGAAPPEAPEGGGPASAGEGLAVLGDYGVSATGSHLMPDPIWLLSVGGGFDVAIDDNTRYDMARAELWMTGTGEAPQPLEIMSADVGADAAGLDRTVPGHYPIGTLRIGPTTVDMVDNHDNDGLGQTLCEAIYVDILVIEAGATLNTNGCPVYYVTLILDGTVDDPANLIPLPAVCPWDCGGDNDGEVGINDFLAVLAQWGTAGSCDFDGNGVGINDFLDLLANWGPCP